MWIYKYAVCTASVVYVCMLVHIGAVHIRVQCMYVYICSQLVGVRE